METVFNLIDRAAEKGYTLYRLSQLTGISAGNLSEMQHGGRPISPENAALIAAAIGEDARIAALNAMISRAKADKRPALAKALRTENGLYIMSTLRAALGWLRLRDRPHNQLKLASR